MVSVNPVNMLNLQEGWQWWQAANRGQEGGSADRGYPIQAKLVKRIAKGEFVDMAELLKDNMEMERSEERDSEYTDHQGAIMNMQTTRVVN